MAFSRVWFVASSLFVEPVQASSLELADLRLHNSTQGDGPPLALTLFFLFFFQSSFKELQFSEPDIAFVPVHHSITGTIRCQGTANLLIYNNQLSFFCKALLIVANN